jgi:SAM-dependent methyltransferase
MASTKFHFIDDYRQLVRDLLSRYPRAEALSRAVGGSFDALGEIEKQLLIQAGLQPNHTLIDVGCGSGRLASALKPYLTQGMYYGTDVVAELLDYAREQAPPSWQFAQVEDVRIPFAENVADFACFFSVFTHLLHEETYCYLLHARRAVKPGGRIVFSFLEFPHNWDVFEATYRNVLSGQGNVHLNTFIGRDAIDCWAQRLGMRVAEIRAANEPFIPLTRTVMFDNGLAASGIVALGQSVCVLINDKGAAAS